MVPLHHMLNNGQPQAGSLSACGEKRLENTLLCFVRHAVPGITYTQQYPPRAPLCRQLDTWLARRPGLARLQRVFQEVEQRPAQRLAPADDDSVSDLHRHRKLYALLLAQGLHGLSCVGNERGRTHMPLPENIRVRQ